MPNKRTPPGEPMRVVYAKDPAFRALDRATKGMTPSERVDFSRNMIKSIDAQRVADEAQAGVTAVVSKTQTASREANAIFNRMAKLPTPMAPDAQAGPASRTPDGKRK
jgi:hypothetical protein